MRRVVPWILLLFAALACDGRDADVSAPTAPAALPAASTVRFDVPKVSRELRDYLRAEPETDAPDASVELEIREIERRAEAGEAPAQTLFAHMHRDGLGTALDPVLAVEWYRKAANQEYAPGQLGLARMLESGLGVARSLTRAIALYRAAAEQGSDAAMYHLALAYLNGEGVAPDAAAAARLARAAADLGNGRAQGLLGYLYANGRGVERDLVQAHAWSAVAAANGEWNAREARDEYESCCMSEQEVARAQELARRYAAAGRTTAE